VTVDQSAILLEPNKNVVVTVTVRVPALAETDVDLMFVQDASGSMADDMVLFSSQVATLVTSLRNVSKSAFTGLATFIEKPVFPQGFGPLDDKYRLADGSVRNYVYRLETPLSANATALSSALSSVEATSNRDLPEAAFEAISQVLACDNIGWRETARKIVVVATDAKFHADVDPTGPEWYASGVAQMPPYDGHCYAPAATIRRERRSPRCSRSATLFRSSPSRITVKTTRPQRKSSSGASFTGSRSGSAPLCRSRSTAATWSSCLSLLWRKSTNWSPSTRGLTRCRCRWSSR
jgi:hypothetical protein